MKFLVVILFVGFLYCMWKFILQPKSQHIHTRLNLNFSKLLKFPKKSTLTVEPRPVTVQAVNEEDIRLFDDVAKLLFEKAYQKSKLDCANQIQSEFLNKMPTQAQSQINQFDREEWSIYWSYKTQSLEYYASRFGVFYTHVDARGIEHRKEFRKMVA